MTTELAVVRQSQLPRTAPMTLPEKIQYCEAFAGSNLLPAQYRDKPANLLFAVEYAEALGIQPIHAITSIHVIEGKPSASADLMGVMVRKAGHKLRVKGDDTSATATLIRADDPDYPFEATWTLDRARQAELTGKKIWKQYPAAMLKARAISEACRAGASEALFGVIYTPEELGAEVDGEGNVVKVESSRDDQPAPQREQATGGGRPTAARQDRPVHAVPDPAPTGAVTVTEDPASWTDEQWLTRIAAIASAADGKAMWNSLTDALLAHDVEDGDGNVYTVKERIIGRVEALGREAGKPTAAPAPEPAPAGPAEETPAQETPADPEPEGEVLEGELLPAKVEPDPEDTRKPSPARRNYIGALQELYGGSESVFRSACEQEFGMPFEHVATSRLREWMTREQQAAAK